MIIVSSRSACRKLSRVLIGLALAAELSGCDRSWSYRAIGGLPVMADGLRFDVDGPAETRLRVHATLFTVHLWLDVDLQNVGDSPLQVKPDNLFVMRGSEVMQIGWSRRCQGRTGQEVVLVKGDSCLMRAEVLATQSDSALRELTIVHLGVSRAGNPVQVLIALERL